MLSVYSIIKPPKSGNCTILEGTSIQYLKLITLIYFNFLDNVPVISICDLRDIVSEQNINSERSIKINILKKKIDSIVEDGQWDLDDVFQDHNYCKTTDSTVFECVVYFLAG